MCIHVYIHVYICIYTYIYIYIHKYIYIYIHVYLYTYIYIYIHMYLERYVKSSICGLLRNRQAFCHFRRRRRQDPIHGRRDIGGVRVQGVSCGAEDKKEFRLGPLHVCTYMYIYIYVHPDMHMYMYIYIRTNTNIIIHVYVCMYREVLWGLHQELAMPVEGQVVQGLLWLTLLQNREMDHAETPAM